MQDCLFCKIAKGEIPAKKIYEDADVLAFLDINPANPGHTLVIPKKHSADIMGADEKDIGKLMNVAKKIAAKLKEKLNAEGVNIVQNNGQAAGQIVHHLHFHVIPRFRGDKVIITYQRIQVKEEEMEDIRKKLSEEKKSSGMDFDF